MQLALYALPFEAHKTLWDTLDVGYFMRHDASDIAWHARALSRRSACRSTQRKAIVRARLSPVGEGLQVLVYTPDQPDLFARICGYFDQARLQHPGRQGAHRQQRLRARHLPGRDHDAAGALPRARSAWWRSDLTQTIDASRPAARAEPRPRVAPRQELPDRAARAPAARREGAALAADHLRQRPRRPALFGGPRAGTAPHQPATGQGHDAGRAGGRHLPDRRPGAAAQPAQIEIETELLEALSV